MTLSLLRSTTPPYTNLSGKERTLGMPGWLTLVHMTFLTEEAGKTVEAWTIDDVHWLNFGLNVTGCAACGFLVRRLVITRSSGGLRE